MAVVTGPGAFQHLAEAASTKPTFHHGSNVYPSAMEATNNPAKPYWKFFWAVFLVIALTIGGLNAHYLFRTQLHESGDLAADSFAIREAKDFRRLTGQYSRWGFSHPGPGWFYVMAASEALFHDKLGLTPSALNAQFLIVFLINAAFLAATIAVIAREGSGWLAVAACTAVLSLYYAVLHISGWLSNWPPHYMVAPFACLLITSASVGLGRGQDLPLLCLAGSALLNAHVAQPLFVGPICLLAYVGLLRHTRWQPWRAFPRAHGIAGTILFLSALPVMIDLTRGSESNLHLILQHTRSHQGEKHSWINALYYYIRLATFKPIVGGEGYLTGTATWTEIGRYGLRHAGIFGAWIVAVAVLAGGFVKWRLGAFLLINLILTAVLSLYWAHIQDGELLYFNSWFVYGALLALGLGAAGGAITLGHVHFPAVLEKRAVKIGLMFLVAGLFLTEARRYRITGETRESSRRLPDGVTAALAADSEGKGRTKYLLFPAEQWEVAAGVALELTRRGEPFRVLRSWGPIFGRDHTLILQGSLDVAPVELMRIWRIIPTPAGPSANPVFPTFERSAISLASPIVDPAMGTAITFSGPQPNAGEFLVFGWTPPVPGEEFTFTEQKEALLSFRPSPVPPGTSVEITVDAFPALHPGKVDFQIAELFFNGKFLDVCSRTADQPMRASIPAAAWNAQRNALLMWRFPQAASPKDMGLSPDIREFGFGFRRVIFSLNTPEK